MSAPASVDDRALGTGVRVVVTEPDLLSAAKAAVDATLRDIDDACSRFRADSELSRLNARPGIEVLVSELLAHAIDDGLRGARMTDGDVDPTVGTAMRIAGYDVDFDALARDGAPLVITAAPVPGWQTVRFNRVARTVTLQHGVEIDLGATAKALAADLAAAAALRAMDERGGVLVSLGGDIALAGEAPEDGWVIQVSDDSSAPVGAGEEAIALRGGAIASSSTRVRRWRRGDVEMHHIIDPRTGAPAVTPWRLASVVAGTCVDANIASTAAIIRGDAAPEWLARLGLPARLVSNGGDVVRIAGWPAPQAGATI